MSALPASFSLLPVPLLCAASLLGGTQDEWAPGELEETLSEVRAGIEAIRGKPFRSEVKIELIDESSFLRLTETRLSAWLAPSNVTGAETTAKLLGMIPGDMDLMAVLRDVVRQSIGGFYDAADETLYIVDSLTGGLAKLVLAHELTHALDDQYHDLDGTEAQFERNSDRALAHQAVVEGSGRALQMRWMMQNIRNLSLKEILRAQANLNRETLETSPHFVWAPLFAMTYRGESFLRRTNAMRIAAGSVRMEDIERAFTELPRSTEQILHPVKYWKSDRQDEPRSVHCSSADVPAGWEAVYEDTLGELYLAICTIPLEARAAGHDPQFAQRYTNDAAKGWGGDRFVLLESEGRFVLRLYTCWDTVEDALEFRDALDSMQAGIAAMIGRMPGVEQDEVGIDVRAGAGDVVFVTAWSGLAPEAARAVAESVHFAEDESE
jgi:hypothetical protein